MSSKNEIRQFVVENTQLSLLQDNIMMQIDIQKQIGMRVVRQLGRGSFATVYYCMDNITSQSFAVKLFYKQDFTKKKIQSFRKQAQILAKIQHKNVVKFKKFLQTQSLLCLVMEYIAGGTLKSLMNKHIENNNQFTDEQIALIIKSILEGIKYIHKFNIIHRDLKLGMYSSYNADPQDLTSIKIVDFGLSAQVELGAHANVKSQCGTLLYMAPQILHQPSYSKSVDMWSCAVIMYMLFSRGKHPIFKQGMGSEEFKEKLKVCTFPKIRNPLANNFLMNISKLQYTERYSVNQALKHPWITGNQNDQIPLSVNESIQSFNTSNRIANVPMLITQSLRLLIILSTMCQTPKSVPEQYITKLKTFQQHHQSQRGLSPSYKNTRRKTNQIIIQLKQLLVNQELNQHNHLSNLLQIDSPIVRKHQKMVLRLFQKNKFQSLDTIGLQQCQQINNQQQDNQQIIKQTIDVQNMEEPESPTQCYSSLAINHHHHSSIQHSDLQIVPKKVQKSKGKGLLMKMNSLKVQTGKDLPNIRYLKNNVSKNSSIQASEIQKMRKNILKKQQFKQQMSKHSLKKPGNVQKGKTVSKGKDVRPMVFGIKTSHY